MENSTNMEKTGNMENSGSMAQIREVIETLEQKVNAARRVPMTGYFMIEGAVIVDLVGQLRYGLPRAVKEATAVLKEEADILAQARAEADKTANKADALYAETVTKANEISETIHREADQYDKATRENARLECEAMIADAQTRAEAIILNAQQQAQKMVDENEITRRAQAYAMETREHAQQDADSIYNQACVHADKMLSGAAAALSRSANDLAALRDSLLSQGGGL